LEIFGSYRHIFENSPVMEQQQWLVQACTCVPKRGTSRRHRLQLRLLSLTSYVEGRSCGNVSHPSRLSSTIAKLGSIRLKEGDRGQIISQSYGHQRLSAEFWRVCKATNRSYLALKSSKLLIKCMSRFHIPSTTLRGSAQALRGLDLQHVSLASLSRLLSESSTTGFLDLTLNVEYYLPIEPRTS
jgi:hypothetical protein